MRLFLAVLFAATLAHAQGPWIKDGQWVYAIPNPLPMGNGFAKFDPSEDDFLATGARRATEAEIAAQALIVKNVTLPDAIDRYKNRKKKQALNELLEQMEEIVKGASEVPPAADPTAELIDLQ